MPIDVKEYVEDALAKAIAEDTAPFEWSFEPYAQYLCKVSTVVSFRGIFLGREYKGYLIRDVDGEILSATKMEDA